MTIKELIAIFNDTASFSMQEDYDNSGLLVGDSSNEIKKALITLDITESVMDEAINKNCNLIISHHPLIFKGLKKITGKTQTENILIKAIKNDISIISLHTNLDNISEGVNKKICEKIGLKNTKILDKKKGLLKKLVVFCPVDHANNVRMAIFKAGGGKIGDYDWCSYNIEGEGSFRAGEGANPFVGNVKELHFEKEIRIETIYPSYIEEQIIKSMIEAHPYEEVAYDIYPLDNYFDKIGSGMIGQLEKAINPEELLKLLEKQFKTGIIRHSNIHKDEIKTIAVCGGSGSFLINKAIQENADAFITADIKYHQFLDAENKIILADIGHYESEQFTKELIYEIISKKNINFAVQVSEINSNPVNYFRTQ